MSVWGGLRYSVLLSFAAVVALGLASDAPNAATTGHVNFVLGMKQLGGDDWGHLENQVAFGAETTFGGESWPVHIAVDVFYTGDEDDDGPVHIEGFTSHLDVGVRRIWEAGSMHPYAGGGIALVRADADFKLDVGGGVEHLGDDDVAMGGWVGGGVFWEFGPRMNLGVSLRYSRAEVTLFENDVEAGGLQAGVLFGVAWPPR